MSGPSTRAVFLRRLTFRVVLNGAYRDVAILTMLVAGCAMALAMLAGLNPRWPFQVRQTPLVGNFALLAWLALFFVDVTHVATLGRVERALSGKPLLADVEYLLSYLVPPDGERRGGALFGFISSILPVTPEDVADKSVIRAHHQHNRAVVAAPVSVMLIGIAMLALLPVQVLVVSGWFGLGGAFVLLVLPRRPRNTV